MKALVIALLFWSVVAQVQAQAPLSDAAFSKTFRCPENLPTDQAREDSLRGFLKWAQQRHPDFTVSKAFELRTRLLEEHHCDKTLANIKSSSAQGDNRPPRNICTADDGRKYFTDERAANCVPVPLERGWVNFYSKPKVLVDILPTKVVKERDGTKIWAQFFMAEPVDSNEGWRYDYLKSITKFYCGTKQQLLIQGTYALNGRIVYERSSAESLMEEIEPDTLAEVLYDYFCRK